MTQTTPLQFWDLWYPQAGATGIAFARGRLAPTDSLIVHAPPPMLSVEIRASDGQRLAYSPDLAQTADRPMAVLTRQGDQVLRQDRWPTQDDIGQLVLLPGGEVGTLLQWWQAPDDSEWRWQIEFYNHR